MHCHESENADTGLHVASPVGTGGSGDPLIGKLMAQQAIAEYGPVRLLSVHDVQDEDVVFPVASIGAPTLILEKVPNGDEGYLAVKRMEPHPGKQDWGDGLAAPYGSSSIF